MCSQQWISKWNFANLKVMLVSIHHSIGHSIFCNVLLNNNQSFKSVNLLISKFLGNQTTYENNHFSLIHFISLFIFYCKFYKTLEYLLYQFYIYTINECIYCHHLKYFYRINSLFEVWFHFELLTLKCERMVSEFYFKMY